MYDNGGRLVMKVQRSQNRLYKIILNLAKPACLATMMDDDTWLWHARMGHVNFGCLESISRKGIVHGLPDLSHPSKVCEGCIVAKQTRQTFPSETQWRASKPLELVSADLCGPITPQTMGGNRYFMLIVDDFSRYMWVYLIKTKDEALSMFKCFKAQVEKESMNKVKMLRTDRGGEFNSQVFNEFCKQEGIQHQLTAPYSPQQNGAVERRNRTVLGMTRALLKSMNVPETLWGEAVRHSVYLLNRITTKAVKNMTPYEGWKGRKPTLRHLKVFGCVAHVKKTSNHVTKLEDRSVAMVHLGVEEGSKAYRLFNPTQRRIVVARDIVFNEKKSWTWNEAHGEQPVSNTNWVNVQVGNTGEGLSQNQWFESSGLQDEQESTPGSMSSTTQGSSGDRSVIGPTYDHTPLQGFCLVGDLYQRTEPIETEELLLVDGEPTTYKEAACIKAWKDAMQVELDSITKNKTWNLVRLPAGQKAIGLKWVYKLKRDASGNVTKHKARLVAKGYVQRKGVDFDEVFAPVARMETIRLLLALAAREGYITSMSSQPS
ncbi:hypothetical protein L1987_30412 [Smallanthus sonchifolius]|uniref:Uncharacterized protein n=1 Tax=Smallanthus sonchifolius TaxID=185202 RepID=A0ACB9I2I9_9ASTR|nr:hypothetical protein L1987_30412 [Smallanthus sonchifolius]